MDAVANFRQAWALPDSRGEISGYRLLVAGDAELRRRAYRLAHRLYREAGLTVPAGEFLVSPFDSQAETVVLLIEDACGRDLATLTVNFDGRAGLPCDASFAPTVSQLRANGLRLAEVTRLAAVKDCDSRALLGYLFQFGLIYGWYVHPTDACVIEVRPWHGRYYQRMFGFEQIGPLSLCQRVNHVAALLKLDMQHCRSHVLGERARGFHRPYLEESMQWRIAGFLKQAHVPMDDSELLRYGFAPRREMGMPAEQLTGTGR